MANKKRQKASEKLVLTADLVEQKIYVIRGRRIMLDADLAEVYGVTTSRLNEQVKRNRRRFPEDFIFQLTKEEFDNLSQFATGFKHRDPRKLPFAFTEHGAVMLASILNSPIAVEASIQVVRAFVQLRTVLSIRKDLAGKIEEIQQKIGEHEQNFKAVFEMLKPIMVIERKEKRQIGFVEKAEKKRKKQ
ncbi:MAG: ORF6N domain-containing protein [Acidobacteria bacterium]|nr:ORF6N domain-containing protein [Acidobacteriota bacterium]